MSTNSISQVEPSSSIRSLAPAAVCAARIGAVIGFAALTAAAAAIKYPVPGSPVPATLQTLVVVACGLLLGPWLGSASMVLYLAFGAIGLPVFAGGGGGVQTIAGATGGYLIAFALVQPILGRFVSAERRSVIRLLASLLMAQTLIFACGVAWLKLAGNLAWADALRMGFWPFVPVDALLKTVGALGIAAVLMRASRRALAIR